MLRQLGNAITSRKFLISAGLTAIYVVLFRLYEQSNVPITIFTILPVLSFAWFYGLRIGIAAALFSVLLNVSLLLIVVGDIPVSFLRGGIPGHFVSLVAAGFVGQLHDVQKRLKQELQERRLVEEALRESEARARRLALVAKHTHSGVLITDVENRIEWLNEGFTRITGYTLSEVKGKRPSELLRPIVKAYINEVKMQGRGVAIESINHRKSGEPYWCQVEIQPLYGEDGALTGYMSVETDISERKESEERYRMLMQQSVEAIYINDVESMRLMEANPTFLNLLGYSQEEMAGLRLYDFIAHEPESIDQIMSHIVAHGATNLGERRWQRKDGTLVDVEVSASKIQQRGKNISFVIARDITERKKAREKLRQAEQRYRSLFEDAPAMYLITNNEDGQPIISDCNELFLKNLGFEPAEVIGRSLIDFYTPDSQARLLGGGYESALNDSFESEERELVAKDGRIIPTLLRAVSERDLTGQVKGTRAMFIDITELKKAEAELAEERAMLATRVEERTAELQAANAELTRAVRAKDEFLATMSHELRTPLNAILTKTEIFQEGILGSVSDRQRHSLHVIEENGRHLLSLISDVLDVAKIGAGRLDLELFTVDFGEVCQASLRLVKVLAHEKQISLELSLDTVTTTLRADGRRLKQILVNLLSNAIKFTPEGGQVGLEVTEGHGKIHFAVWDTGIGISQEGVQYIQQEADKAIPFVQLDSSLSRQYEGTGLGLSLVYRLTEMHGGTVSIESQLGQGSRFTVSLPRQSGDKVKSTANPTDGEGAGLKTTLPAPSPPHTGLILVVEDNPAGSEALFEFLEFQGFTVEIATNGLEAIEHVKKRRPDLVLMDAQMPVMDGLEATRRLRADSSLANMPIIMLTALVMPEDKERCLSAGANDFLGKPITLTDLLGMVETYLPS